MNLRWLFVALCFGSTPMLMTGKAVAGEASNAFHRVSCTIVRFYVAKYSEAAAEQYARSKGATDADIESARRCLKGGGVIQTAQSLPN